MKKHTNPEALHRVARPTYHHGSLRAALLEIGLKMLQQDEVDISLREMARIAGVSATSVYRHFPDKDALLVALSGEGLHRLANVQRKASAAAGGGLPGFLAMGEAYVRFALKNPALFRLFYAYPPEHDRKDKTLGGVSAAMDFLMETAPNVAPPGVDARLFALRSWSLVHGLAMLMLDRQIPVDYKMVTAVLSQKYP